MVNTVQKLQYIPVPGTHRNDVIRCHYKIYIVYNTNPLPLQEQEQGVL